MKDSEYNWETEEWPLEKDEPATLDESVVHISNRKNEESLETRKARKKKADMMQKSAGMVTGAVAIAVIAGTIPGGIKGSGKICPICSEVSCHYWNSGHECETLRVELEGNQYTKRTGSAYQMGLFEDELDLTQTVDSYAVIMKDGSRAFLRFRENDRIFYSWVRNGYRDDHLDEASAEPMAMITYEGSVSHGWLREETGLYTVIQLIYSETGEKPSDVVIYEEEELAYVELKQAEISDNIWLRVASNESEIDCKAILDDCEVFLVESDQHSFDLGSTMQFYETPELYRVWSDDYHTGMTMLRGDVELVTTEDYRQVEYNLEGNHWCQFEFAECTYEDIYAEWKELNRLAPLKGHRVVWPIYQLADFEYNDITYQVYLRDEETKLQSGYELVLSPEQEKNCSVQMSVDLVVEPTSLDERDRIEDILEEYSYSNVTEILGSIYLADEEPSAEWFEKYGGEFTWPHVEGYGSTIDSGDNNNQGFDSDIGNAAGFLSNGLMDMSEFPFYGKANGGVIPVSVEYASKLLDYSGKEVAPYVMGYPWKEPTESGYTIMANMDKVSSTFYVYNRKGKMMFNWTGSYGTIGIGEANVFWLKQDNGNSYRITYGF